MQKDSSRLKSLTLSVIVCTHRFESLLILQKLIVQLLKQPYLKEILLVVDHNSDLFTFLEKEYQNTMKVKLLKNQFQQGVSGARNTGVLNSKGDVLAFLDDDVILTKDWSKNLVQAFLRSERIVGVGGKIMPAFQNKKPKWFSLITSWNFSITSHFIPEKRIRVPSTIAPTVIGANMAFKRTVFEKVGYFNLKLGRKGKKLLAGEEWEFSIRIYTKMPFKWIIYDPSVIVYHVIGNKRKTIPYLILNAYCTGVTRKIVKSINPAKFNKFSSLTSYITREKLRQNLELFRGTNTSQLITGLIVILFIFLGYTFGSLKNLSFHV